MADAETFCRCNFQIYSGKVGNAPEKGQGAHVVSDMTGELPAGYNVTTDNFFTSVQLADRLLARGITLVETMRCNSNVPRELLVTKIVQLILAFSATRITIH